MTATPFTNSPLELFSLTNLFMTHKSDKITTNKEEFIKKYMTSENILSDNGVKIIANKLAGHISYLNREKDPTQFAQPIMINVPILMTHIENEELRDAVYLNNKFNNIAKDVEELIASLKVKIKNMKADYKLKKKLYTETKSTLSKEEAKALNDDLKDILNNIKDLEEEIDNYKKTKNDSKEKIKELKEKIKIIKKSLLQEYILYTKCMHLKYKNNKTQVKTQKKMLKN
jgi:hypothetical protein